MPADFSREFLAVSSAASARWCGNAPLGRAADKDEWGGFPVGVQTISLRKYPLPEVLRHLQGMGVRYVEFSAGSHLPATASDEQIREARQLASRMRGDSFDEYPRAFVLLS